jgi:hypothetical protein
MGRHWCGTCEAGYQGYGYEPGDTITVGDAFCESMKVAMTELGNVLEKAYALGLYDDPNVITAAALWDKNTGFWSRAWVYLPIGDACANDSQEVMASVNAVRSLIGSQTGSTPPLVEPNFKPPAVEGSGGVVGGLFGTVPTWAIVLGGGVVAVMLLGQLTPIVMTFKNLFGTSKKRAMAGYKKGRMRR